MKSFLIGSCKFVSAYAAFGVIREDVIVNVIRSNALLRLSLFIASILCLYRSPQRCPALLSPNATRLVIPAAAMPYVISYQKEYRTDERHSHRRLFSFVSSWTKCFFESSREVLQGSRVANQRYLHMRKNPLSISIWVADCRVFVSVKKTLLAWNNVWNFRRFSQNRRQVLYSVPHK